MDAPFTLDPAAAMPIPNWTDALARAREGADRAETAPQGEGTSQGEAAPFGFRPSRGAALFEPPAREGTEFRPGEPHFADPPADAPSSPSEANVELIQNLIKKLADELNGKTPAAKPPPANETEAMIARSVAALDTAARTMRAPAADHDARSAAAPLPASPGVPPWWPVAANPSRSAAGADANTDGPPMLDPHLARIAEAVAAERMDVLLEPIHALAEGRTRHFEVSVRLLTADGASLEQGDFSRAALGSGLMPRIDAAKMLRAARVARRLGERGRQGSVLTTVAGESLTDENFLDATAMQLGTDGRMSLVLSFAQSEVRAFTPGHAEALGSMAAAGFTYALEEVTDLDMDFGKLKAMGFDFVKLDAPVFLDGLAASGGRIPASDICRYLADNGLTLIVGQIEDDWLLARVLGFGVLFGKGTLFGGPKLVKSEIVAEMGSAAA
jgi:cyclic-di-GMP phosphodiesterase TipF (flagellum assembly factor)